MGMQGRHKPGEPLQMEKKNKGSLGPRPGLESLFLRDYGQVVLLSLGHWIQILELFPLGFRYQNLDTSFRGTNRHPVTEEAVVRDLARHPCREVDQSARISCDHQLFCSGLLVSYVPADGHSMSKEGHCNSQRVQRGPSFCLCIPSENSGGNS